MLFYQDITLMPDGDVDIAFVWRKVFMQAHLAIVDNFGCDGEQNEVAVGFPKYGDSGFALGNSLRVFAKTKEALESLNLKRWLSRWQDYAHIKSIKAVPECSEFVSFVRKAPKGKARIQRDVLYFAKKFAEKSGKPYAECLDFFEKSKPKEGCDLPYLWMESVTTNKREGHTKTFPLYVEKVLSSVPQGGGFSSYGLSSKSNSQLATVPYF